MNTKNSGNPSEKPKEDSSKNDSWDCVEIVEGAVEIVGGVLESGVEVLSGILSLTGE